MLNLQPTAELRCYGSEQIQAIWPVAKPLIQKALDRGSIYSIDEIYMGLRRKEMQLWMWADKAALLTVIQNIEGKLHCLLLALAGESMPARSSKATAEAGTQWGRVTSIELLIFVGRFFIGCVVCSGW